MRLEIQMIVFDGTVDSRVYDVGETRGVALETSPITPLPEAVMVRLKLHHVDAEPRAERALGQHFIEAHRVGNDLTLGLKLLAHCILERLDADCFDVGGPFAGVASELVSVEVLGPQFRSQRLGDSSGLADTISAFDPDEFRHLRVSVQDIQQCGHRVGGTLKSTEQHGVTPLLEAENLAGRVSQSRPPGGARKKPARSNRTVPRPLTQNYAKSRVLRYT